MTKRTPSPRNDHANAASPFPPATHALYIEDERFPKDCCPMGSLKELSALYETYIEEQLKDVRSAAGRKALLRDIEDQTVLYELKQQPETHIPKGGLLGTGLDPKLPKFDPEKVFETLENIDVNKVAAKATDVGLMALELVFNWKNPITIARYGVKGKRAFDVAKGVVTRADEVRRDAMTHLAGGSDADAVVQGGARFVKLSWLARPSNATKLDNLDLLGDAEEKPATRKRPSSSRGGRKGPSQG